MTEKPVDAVVAPPLPSASAPDHEADSAPSADAPPAPSADAPIEVLHRRAPRYGRFIVTGLLVGGLMSFLTAILTRGWSGLSTSNTFWLLLLSFGVLGMLAGAATALVLDRRSIARIEAEKP